MLRAQRAARFERDVKALARRRVDLGPLKEVMSLVLQDTPEARAELRRRHNMHRLRGEWEGSDECHVANADDWLLVWRTGNGVAVFQRTGTHDEIFR